MPQQSLAAVYIASHHRLSLSLPLGTRALARFFLHPLLQQLGLPLPGSVLFSRLHQDRTDARSRLLLLLLLNGEKEFVTRLVTLTRQRLRYRYCGGSGRTCL